MPLSDHVYCVAFAFKMSEWVEQQICIKFCIMLEHYSVETIQMMQKAVATGNWRLAASSQEYTRSSITSHAEVFWQKIKSPRWLRPLQPRFGTLWLLAFPNTEITFEREEISDCEWDSRKYNGAADGDWENCAYFEGDWGIIVLCTMFLVSWIAFSKCLYFSYCMSGYLLDRSCMGHLGFLYWVPENYIITESYCRAS